MLRPPSAPLVMLICALCSGASRGDQPGPAFQPSQRVNDKPNVLLITADDLHYDSLGVTGSKIPGVTPNIDRLASQGMRFTQGYVTIAVCQPCRSVWMTGRYPHRNGAEGFEPIDEHVPTLGESLRKAGYVNGILAKVEHLKPQNKFCWDFVVEGRDLAHGRSPELYYQQAKAFFQKAAVEGRPFFLMANSQDPHRPFAGSEQERQRVGFPGPQARPSRTYQPDGIEIPCFLPDLPDVRLEMAEYFTSVHRCDETVGKLLQALEEAGLADQTLVMFMSDNGMALPFAKTNCYRASTRTPWIVRWPGKVKPGTVDSRHMISGIDLMPTLLAALRLPPVEGMDGRSLLPVLEGRNQEDRDRVFTVFHATAGKGDYPMRSVQDHRFGYIFNAWADGKTEFRNESQSGLTMKAMSAAARTDEAVAARVKHFLYRAEEEFYDYETDPCALKNLIDDPRHRSRIEAFRKELHQWMLAVKDPLLAKYETRLP